LFVKDSSTGSFFHFHVYMYYNLNYFMSSHFLLPILIPYLW
jgi:hypothetical protein